MSPRLENDLALLSTLMVMVCAQASGVYTKIDSSHVAVKPHQLVLSELPARGMVTEAALQLFGSTVTPSLTASAEPYVNGALMAIRKVGTLVGVHRGLDKVMDF